MLQDLVEIQNDALRKSLEARITDFDTTLSDLSLRATPNKAKGVQRLKRPFQRSQNDEYISRIERFKNSFNTILSMDKTYRIPAFARS